MLEQEIQKVADAIVKGFNPEKVVLFGSYAWGKPTKDSDLDFFVVKDDPVKNTREMAVDLQQILINRDVPLDLLIYKPEQVIKRLSMRDGFVKKILEQGKILYER